MDTAHIRDRNYKLVESVRHQNMREQRRLSDQLYSRQGMTAAHKYELASMSYEQKKLKEELTRIQKSTPTTQGRLPPRKQSVTLINIKSDRNTRNLPERRGVTVKKHEENVILLDDRKPRLFNKQGMPLQRAQTESKIESTETTKAKQVSQNRINTETKKAESTLLKFNSSFAANPSPVGFNNILIVENKITDRSVSHSGKSNQPIQKIDVKNARASVKQRLGPTNTENTLKQKKREQSNRMLLGIGIQEQSKQQRTLSPIYEAGADAENNVKKQSMQAVIDTKLKVGEAVLKFRKLKKKQEEDEFDPSRYNPDGSLRTMFKKQDFRKSIAEARRARYVRHKEKQWFEKELTVQQIFDQEAVDDEKEREVSAERGKVQTGW